MNGWYLLFILAVIINGFLMNHHTNLGPDDAIWWLWVLVPSMAHIAGREWRD